MAMSDSAVEARVRRWGHGLALVLPLEWVLRRYGQLPKRLELICGGRRVTLRRATVTARSALYYVKGAGQLALALAEECVPAR